MSHPSEPGFLVLHALRLKGFADDDAVAACTGLDVDAVRVRLKEHAGDGFVVRRDGHISGWSLTSEGKARHADLVASELDRAGARDAVRGIYDRFLQINHEMLAVCTAWQLRDVDDAQAINDHGDADYDQSVIMRLVAIHDRVRPVTADLRERFARFAGYGDRLRAALERVVAGEHEWFTKPVIDSYHTVWFELHEDLLCTLGIERSSEGST